MARSPLPQLRKLCLGLPEATEKEAWGDQAVLVESDPERFYVPPYVGPRGWIGLRLDVLPIDWDDVAEILLESYRLTAPKRLAALLSDD